jgi:NAD(P)-dependent dehydrogenase (short-subunit alcohol dehydrogenase family)
MKDLSGKIALITGGSKGIGFGIANELMKAGVHVVVTSRSQTAADQAANRLNEAHPKAKALGVKADVRILVDQQEAVKMAVSTFGKLDYLIANAGLAHFASIEEMTDTQWKEVIDTNLTGVFYSIKAGVDELIKSKGYFVSISSLAGTNFFAKGAAYNASKFGVTGFTQSIMLDLRDKGVNVTTIMPGSVSSHFNGNSPDEKDAWKIQPEDIGELIVDVFKMNERALPSKIEIRPSQPNSK